MPKIDLTTAAGNAAKLSHNRPAFLTMLDAHETFCRRVLARELAQSSEKQLSLTVFRTSDTLDILLVRDQVIERDNAKHHEQSMPVAIKITLQERETGAHIITAEVRGASSGGVMGQRELIEEKYFSVGEGEELKNRTILAVINALTDAEKEALDIYKWPKPYRAEELAAKPAPAP